MTLLEKHLDVLINDCDEAEIQDSQAAVGGADQITGMRVCMEEACVEQLPARTCRS